MDPADAMRQVAQRYVDGNYFAGIEWHVEHHGQTLSSGRAGCANAATRAPMPDSPIISRKMVEMMRANRIPPSQLPLRIGAIVMPGYGWGLGVRVMTDIGHARSLTSIGELGWAGAASTYFWVDPTEEMHGVVMTQYIGSMVPMTDDMRVAAYRMLA